MTWCPASSNRAVTRDWCTSTWFGGRDHSAVRAGPDRVLQARRAHPLLCRHGPARGQGSAVTLSRTHPDLVRRLFAMESPEVAEGVVEIAGLAREAGYRTKIAVRAMAPQVNAKGACIGPMGQRVRAVTSELQGEKIDIVDWDAGSGRLHRCRTVAGAGTGRADRRRGRPLRKGDRARLPVVPGHRQGGQNARLAARLTGWRLDIHPDTEGWGCARVQATGHFAGVPVSPSRRARTPESNYGQRAVGWLTPHARLVKDCRDEHPGCRQVSCFCTLPRLPVRTCVGCRTRDHQRDLLRVALVTGRVVPDPWNGALRSRCLRTPLAGVRHGCYRPQGVRRGIPHRWTAGSP